MSQFVNKTGMLGPYPGITWEEHARSNGWDEDCPFNYMVVQQIETGSCDHIGCGKQVDPEYQFCSKECFDEMEAEQIAEAEWEARVS